jgi:hypothetical protein
MTYKFAAYTGYDSVAKKWHRLRADSIGATDVLEATGMTDGKIVWEGSTR